MRWGLALVLLYAAGCGRFGFDEQPPGPPPVGFACNVPQRFPTAGLPIAAVSAVSTATAQVVLLADTGGAMAAWSFERDVDVLNPVGANLAIDTDITTTIGAAASGDDIVVSAIHGLSAPAGTRLYPLDSAGNLRGAAVDHVELATDRAVVLGNYGKLAFANIDAATQDLQIRAIDVAGDFASDPVTIAAGATMPNYATVERADTGYLLQWNDMTGLQVALLDDSFAVAAGPVKVNNTTFGPIRPKVAWSAATSTYLVTWYEKNATNDDDIWFQLLTSDLKPVTQPGHLSLFSSRPEIAADDTGYFVAWNNYKVGALEAAHISATGVVALREVTTSGGMAANWTMVRSGGLPVLVWVETGGSGPDLWLDPMCE